MAKIEEPTVKVKVMPDTSEFAALLTQQLDLNDPMAKAILNAAVTTLPSITAQVGDQTFELHHWTITMVDGQRVMRTSWAPKQA